MKQVNFIQRDGTPKSYVTSKQEDTTLYFTGYSDNVETQTRGDGVAFRITGPGELSFQFIDNIYLKDAVVFWKNAIEGDYYNFEVILPANTFFPSFSQTGNYDLDQTTGIPVSNTSNTGSLMMYPIDVVVSRFGNRLPMDGDNPYGLSLESNDTALLPNVLKLRVTVISPTNNTNVKLHWILELYRERTV